LLALIVVGLLVSQLFRRAADGSSGLARFGNRLAATPQLTWVRMRYPGHVRWTLNRLDLTDPRGFLLTLTVALGSLPACSFGGLAQHHWAPRRAYAPAGGAVARSVRRSIVSLRARDRGGRF